MSVGKLRSSAEVAFSNGDMELALKTWGQVSNILNYSEYLKCKILKLPASHLGYKYGASK